MQGGFSLFIPLFFEAEKGPVDNFPPVDNFAAVFISHLAFRRRGLGFGRSPNSKNLCASLRPLCGKTKLISHRGGARRAQRCFGLPSAVSLGFGAEPQL